MERFFRWLSSELSDGQVWTTHITENSVPRRGISKYKGPGLDMSMASLRSRNVTIFLGMDPCT